MKGKHLTDNERFYIEKRTAEGINKSTIAKELSVSRSTITREMQRNTDPDFKGLYCSRRAQTLYRDRRLKAATVKAFSQLNPEIMVYILQELAIHTSPEVIGGVLKRKHGMATTPR